MTQPGSPQLDWTEVDRRAAAGTVRVLAMDAVQTVGNGHPGTAKSLAPAAYLLPAAPPPQPRGPGLNR